MPAVYDLANRGLLPPGFSLVGFARRDWEDEDFAQVVHDAVKEHARTPFREEVWQQLVQGMRFVPGNFDDDDGLRAAASRPSRSWTRRRARAATSPSTSPYRRSSSPRSSSSSRSTGSPTSRRAPGAARSSRSPSATTWRSAQELNAGRARGLPPGPGLPDRPLPRQGDRPEHPGAALRQHDVRADLEPVVTSTTCRSRWPRTSASAAAPATTTASAPPVTSSRTTCSSCWR